MYREKMIFSVLIVAASPADAQAMIRLLPRERYSPVRVVNSAGEAKRTMLSSPADLVLIFSPLPDDFGTDLALRLVSDSSSGVMLLVGTDQFDAVSDRVEDAGVLTVSRPCGKQILSQSVGLLSATCARLRPLAQKAESLKEKMSEIRLVNRAKWLLIEKLGMSEPDAHRYIEKAAMNQCLRRGAVAESIIRTYES